MYIYGKKDDKRFVIGISAKENIKDAICDLRLRGYTLQYADLCEANLREANLREANEWAKVANYEKHELIDPTWSWDCGFKLDFDGPVCRVSSRFYFDKGDQMLSTSLGGSVCVCISNELITRKEFKAVTIDELRIKVEFYVASLQQKFIVFLKGVGNEESKPDEESKPNEESKPDEESNEESK